MSDKISEYLAEQKRLAESATPGPWEALGRTVEQKNWHEGYPDDPVSCEVECSSYCYGGTGKGAQPDDAEFIASARESVPRLVAALEATTGMHREVSRDELSTPYDDQCSAGCREWPCPTIQAIESALGAEADEGGQG